jgi:hypothetical protein
VTGGAAVITIMPRLDSVGLRTVDADGNTTLWRRVQ